MTEEEQLNNLPEKINNDGQYRNADKVRLMLNALRLDTSNVVERVYKHELKFMATDKKDQSKDLSRGPRDDRAKETRRELVWELYMQMLSGNQELFGQNMRMFVYDCGINFYSMKKILDIGTDRQFHLDQNSLSERSQSYLRGRYQSITANILATDEVELRQVNSRPAAQFFDILSNQQMIRDGQYHIFPSKMFRKDSHQQLQNDPRILKEGLQKNVRYVGDDERSAVAVIQIDPKKSAFFPEMRVDEFVSSFLNIRHPRDVFQGRNFQNIQKQFKNLVVTTLHMTKNRSFPMFGIMTTPLREATFESESGPVSVLDYFQRTYNITIKYPDLPCVLERSPKPGGGYRESKHPMEVLKILPGQRVPLQKQTPQLVEQMIRSCQALPRDFERNINNQVSATQIRSDNPYLKQHNLRVDSKLMTSDSEVLFPPAIVYTENQDVVEPNNHGEMLWKMERNRRFLNPASMDKTWAAVIVAGGVSGADVEEFIQRFLVVCNSRGCSIEPPLEKKVFDRTDLEYLREKFAFYKQYKCRFVLFFSEDKTNTSHHHPFKLMEIEFGIPTQHITKMILEKALGRRGGGQQLVADNLLLKFNLKLGGCNHALVTPAAFRQLNGTRDIFSNEWLDSGRMFFGLSITHAAPQSLYERKSNIAVGEPSIVGMAYTINSKVIDMRGTYWLQEARKTTIQYLEVYFRKALHEYEMRNGKLPTHLIVFRSGASEGEYQKIATHEFDAIQQAIKESCKPGVRPPGVTILVCQRASNYRVVPSNINPQAKPAQQNVRPGTVVDRVVMHASFTEFLLIGHTAIQGTAQPVRCTVVVDTGAPDRLSLQQLEYITYSMCYAHGIVTCPVSVPAQLYAAQELAKRGRNNYKTKNFEGEDRGSDSSGGRYRVKAADPEAGPTEEELQRFFLRISQELEPKIDSKFWA